MNLDHEFGSSRQIFLDITVRPSYPLPSQKLTLAISSLAKEVSAVAAKKNGNTIKAKLGEIKTKCGERHTKIRDQK
jgi:hypothetical protein